MDNQHRKITGYRDLSPESIQLMNDIKILAEQLGEKIALMDRMPNPVPPDHPTQPLITVDKRWLNIGRTQVQQGFMAITRAIAQPTTF